MTNVCWWYDNSCGKCRGSTSYVEKSYFYTTKWYLIHFKLQYYCYLLLCGYTFYTIKDNIVVVFRYISFVFYFNENMAFLPCNDSCFCVSLNFPLSIPGYINLSKILMLSPFRDHFSSDRIFPPFLEITILVFWTLTVIKVPFYCIKYSLLLRKIV